MPNDSEHCCLSCGTDISDKRIDAKYCSSRCRMRYRRKQKKEELIGKLIEIFMTIPNHSAQFTDEGFQLVAPDVMNRSLKKWKLSDLQNMSNKQLRDLLTEKNGVFLVQGARKLFFD